MSRNAILCLFFWDFNWSWKPGLVGLRKKGAKAGDSWVLEGEGQWGFCTGKLPLG